MLTSLALEATISSFVYDPHPEREENTSIRNRARRSTVLSDRESINDKDSEQIVMLAQPKNTHVSAQIIARTNEATRWVSQI